MEYTENINRRKINEKKKERISSQNQNYNYNYLNFDLTLSHPLTIKVINAFLFNIRIFNLQNDRKFSQTFHVENQKEFQISGLLILLIKISSI